MVQGTASSVGKSTLVAGLCRLFARRGLRVAPFKAQNMSNNAAVCPGGGEIGRAQYAQALAARVTPTVDINPVLLKPQGGACQVIVRGQVHGVQAATEYFGARRGDLWWVVVGALDRLRQGYDLVIAEGAGSPAEINLRDRDIVNMRVALHSRADVLLLGDIDRGGVFASLLGTWGWLEPEERALVRGYILNKFRGDPTLLAPAPTLLERRTGVPVLGVVPHVDDLALPEEDAASLTQRNERRVCVEVAVVHLPHLSNFDEFDPLAAEPGVQVRYVCTPEELRAPDLVILPGSKATIPDLLWLHERGFAQRIRWLVWHGTPVLGICGGYQMLGTVVRDPHRAESEQVSAPGVGLLPMETELAGAKRLVRTRGRVRDHRPGLWGAMGGMPVEGYEIHLGHTSGAGTTPLLDLADGPDGAVSADGLAAGTYLHGILERPEPRHALLQELAATRGFSWQPDNGPPADPYDRLADLFEETIQLDAARLPSLASCLADSRPEVAIMPLPADRVRTSATHRRAGRRRLKAP
jgi:adenosylcobyric acid synthase